MEQVAKLLEEKRAEIVLELKNGDKSNNPYDYIEKQGLVDLVKLFASVWCLKYGLVELIYKTNI